jgi:Flp pilus assembly protein TadB
VKIFLATTLFSVAVFLSIKPLPRFAIKLGIPILTFPIAGKRKTKMTFEEEFQFIFNLKSQLHSGANQIDALKFAISRAPEFAFLNTKQALASHSEVLPSLHKDSTEDKFPLLVSCANLLDLSARSGCSITDALTHVSEAHINRRHQEQLISTELASTKATVFLLAGLPILGAGMGLILGADSISWLVGAATGRACLITGTSLELVGWFWIRRLLDRALADET